MTPGETSEPVCLCQRPAQAGVQREGLHRPGLGASSCSLPSRTFLPIWERQAAAGGDLVSPASFQASLRELGATWSREGSSNPPSNCHSCCHLSLLSQTETPPSLAQTSGVRCPLSQRGSSWISLCPHRVPSLPLCLVIWFVFLNKRWTLPVTVAFPVRCSL